MLRFILTVLLVSVGVLCVLGVVLLIMSLGRPSPVVDADGRPMMGSISEKVRLPINGVEQGMFIRSRDTTKPVLLFVHGGAFLALFDNRFEHGVYLLDEPEAALSPQRQLSFLKILHDLTSPGQAQFIIATHSPILLAYPGATIYHFGNTGIAPVAYTDTEHYRLTRDFLDAPARYLKRLFDDVADGPADG